MKQILLFALALSVLGVAQAQSTPAQPTTPQNSLLGTWQTSIPYDPPVVGVVTFRHDGSFRSEMVIEGQTAGFWEGSYTLDLDGTLTQNETSWSPQLCFRDRCEPNEGASGIVSLLVAQSPDSFTLRYAENSAFTFERVAPRSEPVDPQCDDVAFAPDCEPAEPDNILTRLGIGASHWTGGYSDGDTVTLSFFVPGVSSLFFYDQREELSLQGTNERLTGISLTSTYPVLIERAGGYVILSYGDERYVLTPVATP